MNKTNAVDSNTVCRTDVPGFDEILGGGLPRNRIYLVQDAFAQGEHRGKEKTHRFGGLGLGVAISRNLVEPHSGRIRASSAGVGSGSTFTIELPLLAAGPAVG